MFLLPSFAIASKGKPMIELHEKCTYATSLTLGVTNQFYVNFSPFALVFVTTYNTLVFLGTLILLQYPKPRT